MRMKYLVGVGVVALVTLNAAAAVVLLGILATC
jgi:hypothetical protein